MAKTPETPKNKYYTIIDCCSNQAYVYPTGHPYAGTPVYIKYTGVFFDIAPIDIVSNFEIITSFTDSSGNVTNGCFILKSANPPAGPDPVNTQNWFDAIYTGLVTTPMCCDCNTACNSLFFQWVGVDDITLGQPIYSFVGPTGTYDGHNYYEILNTWIHPVVFVWFSVDDQVWYSSTVLGDVLTIIDTLNLTDSVPATEGAITRWVSGKFQSYICKAIEPIIPVVNPALTYPEERYQLTCCSTGEALVVNGLPGVFVFQGITSNNNHPDDFLEVVLTTIKDINANVITGCYRVTEAECFEEWEEVLWQDFFVETECVSTCQECLPKPVIIPPVTNHKIIYPDFIVNNAEPFDAEQIFCAFGDANYEKVLALRYGIQFCCPTDLMQSTIEHEILKMDIAEDPNACCPVAPLPGTCKKYSVIIPINVEGYLYFKDCNRVVRTVMFYSASTPYEVFVCGTTGQTSADIYILANNQDLLQVQFSEGVDCN